MSQPGALVVSLALLVGAVGLGCALGSVNVPLADVVAALFGGTPANPDWGVIVRELRLPRVLLGAVVGAALGLAGAALQGLFRNPLAEPYVLGVSAGAALGAVTALVLGLGGAWLGLGAVPLAAFGGAAGATLLVYRLARVGDALPGAALLLAGVAVGLTLGAGVSLLIYVAGERAGDVVLWLMGHLGGATPAEVGWAVACLAIGGAVVGGAARDLNAMALGEEAARGLGVDTARLEVALLVATALLVAGAVAFCGVIGFVGLIVPHAVRMWIGPDHRWLLPVSAVAGAAALVLADTAARTLLSGRELPVGVITGALGGPFFLVLLRRSLVRPRGGDRAAGKRLAPAVAPGKRLAPAAAPSAVPEAAPAAGGGALAARAAEAPHGLAQPVDLQIESGSFTVIVGPNGAGKSTLLRLLAGVLRPRAGEVRLDDADLATLARRAVARRIAWVQQGVAEGFDFTVQETVSMGRHPHLRRLRGPTAADDAAVGAALARAGLAALRDRPLSTLSGGERQRVAVARALAQAPRVLLLDEPTAHLDLAQQRALLDLVAALNREAGLTVVAVLHDLQLAATYAGRVLVLARGAVVADGPPAVLTPERIAAVFGLPDFSLPN